MSNRLYELDNRIRVLPVRKSHKGLHNSDKLRFCIMGINRNVRWLFYRGQQSILSNSMLEAMAIGLPCVCTDCDGGGAREVITDGENGILVKSNDITALYLGMKKMIDDPQRAEKMGTQAMKIKEKTNIHDVATKWESILEKLNCEIFDACS